MGINIRHLVRNQGGNLLNHEGVPLRRGVHQAEARFPGSPSAVGYPQPNEQTKHHEPRQGDADYHLEKREAQAIG